MNFGIMGVAGFVAARHLQAIKDTGNKIVAAIDPYDIVGKLDLYGLDIKYSQDTRLLHDVPLDWLSVCTPSYLHPSHTIFGLGLGCNVICEKPLALNPHDLDIIRAVEAETNKRVYTCLQLRYHPAVLALKSQLTGYHTVKVQYHSPRGPWYWHTWKADLSKSGGVIYDIGIHLFDLLLWLFGPVEKYEVTHHNQWTDSGQLFLERAMVDWSLSIDPKNEKKREIIIDGSRLNLSENFDNLHTEVYRQILAGNGYGVEGARAGIELCHRLTS